MLAERTILHALPWYELYPVDDFALVVGALAHPRTAPEYDFFLFSFFFSLVVLWSLFFRLPVDHPSFYCAQ